MDERTRRTDEELAPNLRRTTPEPDVKSASSSKTRLIIGTIVVLGLLVAGYEALRFVKPTPPSGGRFQNAAAQSVGAATIGTGNVRVIVNALGTVTSLATITVQTQISGQLTEVAFTEGQLVNKGDFLAQIDARPYEIAKAQAEGQLAHDQGLLAQAKMDLTRYQTLAQQNSIARQQAEDQVFIVQQYEGSVKQDQANVDTQALNIAYCRIVSPITGRVGLRLVDPGNYVQVSGSTGIAVLTELQPISVVFSVPEDDLPQILPQLAAGTPMQVTIYDRANIRELATGKVSAIDNQIDTTTGTVKIRAQFDNADNALFPNQFVNARLLLQTLQNVVTVPTAAVQLGAPGGGTTGANSDSGNPGSTRLAAPSSTSSTPSYYVYVLNADDTVSVRQITIGPTDGIMTAVNSGLAAGDHVVTDGTDRLRDGLHVNVSTLDGKPTGNAPGPGVGGQGGRRGGGGNGAGNRENGGAGRNGERSQNPNRTQTQGTTNGGQ